MKHSYRAGLATLVCVCVIGVAGRIVSATADGMAGAPAPQKAVDTDRNSHDCVPMRLETTDYFLDVVSTLPNHLGFPAQIEIRRVRPIYQTGRCRGLVRSAILVHGRTVDGISAFDVPYADYSLHDSDGEQRHRRVRFQSTGVRRVVTLQYGRSVQCRADRRTLR